ncbi:hypothetical protein L873DRAFT_1808013 [Choiromyces venosus 120613-1]|uniref:Uncharacterized protein n=1 Tax=Choiromyces venosus 120613-1 TaxID=1336337 RepID=A0A3N4JPD0_9PEZI|nr:hypothetical protein L873DRAFT_1808013 [Choiromyces venosus 120613-1]
MVSKYSTLLYSVLSIIPSMALTNNPTVPPFSQTFSKTFLHRIPHLLTSEIIAQNSQLVLWP